MSWLDSIRDGYDNVSDWFHTNRAPAAPAAPAPAAPAAGAGAGGGGWGTGDLAKATGLAPWAKAFGVGQGTPAKVDPSAPAPVAPAAPVGGKGKVTGAGVTKEGFGRDSKGGFKTPEYSNWGGKGTSYGNRPDDHNEDGSKKDIKTKGPAVYQPDLSKIGGGAPGSSGYNKKSGVLDKGDAAAKIDENAKAGKGGGYSDSGSFRSSKYGSYSGGTGLASKDEKGNWKPDAKLGINHSGKGSGGLAGVEGQWGAEEKGGWRATAMSENKRHSASAEAGWVASGGASGSAGFDLEKGAYAQGGFGGKVGAYASGDADTKTGSVKVGGEDFDMGAGVHGEAFVGAKAGAKAEIGFGPEFAGAKGEIGAFAGAEAAGDVHANLGPVGGKVGGSVMAGAGIGAEGDLSYKDGKFHVGGKMFAALGYGGSLSGDVTIDVGAMGRAGASLASDAGSAIASGASAAGSAISSGASAVADAGGRAVSAVLSW